MMILIYEIKKIKKIKNKKDRKKEKRMRLDLHPPNTWPECVGSGESYFGSFLLG